MELLQDTGCYKEKPNPTDLQVSDKFSQITSKWLNLVPGKLEFLRTSNFKDLQVLLWMFSTTCLSISFPKYLGMQWEKTALSCAILLFVYQGKPHCLQSTRNNFLSFKKANKRWRSPLIPAWLHCGYKPIKSKFSIHSSLCKDSTRETETSSRVWSVCGWTE